MAATTTVTATAIPTFAAMDRSLDRSRWFIGEHGPKSRSREHSVLGNSQYPVDITVVVVQHRVCGFGSGQTRHVKATPATCLFRNPVGACVMVGGESSNVDGTVGKATMISKRNCR